MYLWSVNPGVVANHRPADDGDHYRQRAHSMAIITFVESLMSWWAMAQATIMTIAVIGRAAHESAGHAGEPSDHQVRVVRCGWRGAGDSEPHRPEVHPTGHRAQPSGLSQPRRRLPELPTTRTNPRNGICKRINEKAVKVIRKLSQVAFPPRAISSGRIIPMVPVGAITPRVCADVFDNER